MPTNKPNAYLAAHRDENLAALFELLRIPTSIKDAPQDYNRCAEWLRDRLVASGFAAEILTTPDAPPYVFAEYHTSDTAPTVLLYGHYDVQPPDPLDEWTTEPYDPQVRDGKIFARGAADDKGPLFAHIIGIEALLQTIGLGVNLKVLFEGEEEIGSPHIESFLTEHREKLRADTLVISDTAFYASDLPSISVGLRGMMGVEIVCTGADRDVHSGVYG
ncbi:MAG: M20/M25/M40 family metallo-hydrolase, partial [Phycisphaerae bacterium]|nr:M20/M25/M40 family metallo-hydrolase [Phycisphaerae bacterium]